MKGLAIDATNLKNQQDVVKNEVRVNVLNQPYGSFPWIDLPMTANENWYNAHNFYGELKELEAATLEDASAFFRTFYAPNNAVLAIVGDFEPGPAREWVEKYFGLDRQGGSARASGSLRNRGRRRRSAPVVSTSSPRAPRLASPTTFRPLDTGLVCDGSDRPDPGAGTRLATLRRARSAHGPDQ
jgi:predicted Zn-dependent peptidase